MMNAQTILVADDDAAVRTVVTQALSRAGFTVKAAEDGTALYKMVAAGEGDLVVTDVSMPGISGLDLIPKIRALRSDMKIIVISARNALTTAIAASERGALDFLPKPFDIDALVGAVRNAMRAAIPAPVPDADAKLEAMDKAFVVGASPAMQDIYRTIARLRESDLTVLISGESGTGKEVIARALHAFSRRKDGPFVAVNMAALPRELIESELFGHEKGAFTGATRRNAGRFAQAARGTLFLDEIGDMPYEAQTRLLRVLQEGEFTSVGGEKPVKSNVRIVAATNRDLRLLVRNGAFREDLYYRLNVIPLQVPPLRARREDVPALVQHFLNQAGASKVFEPAAMEMICRAPWTGNIRELENFVRRLSALHAQDVIGAEEVADEFSRIAPAAPAGDGGFADIVEHVFASYPGFPPDGLYDRLLRELEKPLIEKTLALTNGNQIKAAEILGLNRNTLRTKIRDLGIEVRRKV